MKQRSRSRRSIANRRVLVMDEPITGLAPCGRVLKGMLRKMARSGAAVLLSTHILEVRSPLRQDRYSGGWIPDRRRTCLNSARRLPSVRRRTTLEDIFVGLAPARNTRRSRFLEARQEGCWSAGNGDSRPPKRKGTLAHESRVSYAVAQLRSGSA